MSRFSDRHYRQIADTGLGVSPLGLGTVKLGRDKGVKYPTSFKIPNDKQAADLIALAADLGVNLIDTAPAYGNSEERLGTLLAGQRDRWVICSKSGEEFDGAGSSYDFSAAHTRSSVQRSLKRLKTDYLDIVLIHSNGDDEKILNDGEALATLQSLKQEGLIRAIGISVKTVAGGLAAARYCDVVMASYHPGYLDEKATLDACEKTNTAILLKKAFASGHFPSDISNPAAESLKFAFSHPAVTSAIIGTINPGHLRDNVNSVIPALITY